MDATISNKKPHGTKDKKKVAARTLEQHTTRHNDEKNQTENGLLLQRPRDTRALNF